MKLLIPFISQLSLQVEGTHDCGASTISRQWAVTAAHCVIRQVDQSQSRICVLSITDFEFKINYVPLKTFRDVRVAD